MLPALSEPPHDPSPLCDCDICQLVRHTLGTFTDPVSVMRCPECGEPLQLGHDCLAESNWCNRPNTNTEDRE